MADKIVFPSDRELFPQFFTPEFDPKTTGYTSARYHFQVELEKKEHYKQEMKQEKTRVTRDQAAELLDRIRRNVSWFSLLAFRPVSDALLKEILQTPDSFPAREVLVEEITYKDEKSRFYFRFSHYMGSLVKALENQQKSESAKKFVEQEIEFRKCGLYEVFSPIYRSGSVVAKEEAKNWKKSVAVILIISVLLIAGFFILRNDPSLITGAMGILLMPVCALGGFGGLILAFCTALVAASVKKDAIKAYALAREAEPYLQKAHRVLRYLILWMDYAGKRDVPFAPDGPPMSESLKQIQEKLDRVVSMINSGAENGK